MVCLVIYLVLLNLGAYNFLSRDNLKLCVQKEQTGKPPIYGPMLYHLSGSGKKEVWFQVVYTGKTLN
jgi:hypothetical protein